MNFLHFQRACAIGAGYTTGVVLVLYFAVALYGLIGGLYS